MTTKSITINGTEYRITGKTGRFCVYRGDFCIGFDIFSMSDAENAAARNAACGDSDEMYILRKNEK